MNKDVFLNNLKLEIKKTDKYHDRIVDIGGVLKRRGQPLLFIIFEIFFYIM